MGRFPVIVTLGAGLLGWVAGEMLVTDSAVAGWIDSSAAYLHYVVPAVGIFVVIAFGKWLASRHAPKAHASA
jgi:predicted tellurium resistance membrane protein TerC